MGWDLIATSGDQHSIFRIPSLWREQCYDDEDGQTHSFGENISFLTIIYPRDARCVASCLEELDPPGDSELQEFIQWLRKWADEDATFELDM